MGKPTPGYDIQVHISEQTYFAVSWLITSVGKVLTENFCDSELMLLPNIPVN